MTDTSVTIGLHDEVLDVVIDDPATAGAAASRIVRSVPVGFGMLRREHLLSDPPRPEELTNAIGTVVDHLDDLVLERPDLIGSATSLRGALAEVVAAVEHGAPAPLPFVISRTAAEEVFRTLATESAAERRHNPGLPPEAVHDVVAACCVVVGVMRSLHLQRVEVQR